MTKEIGSEVEVEVEVENRDLEEGVIQVDLETGADARTEADAMAEAGPNPVG